eukprot:TRINITY_DN1386_c0_g1_i1.p1 TRINITY_DN1386_c0_g1~~TRINITY_DN1386_c0_g1_i1.p1  ORF type:complete len:220 (+),score=70.35 TRINITY_DN1386_c0_g1_i1:133-792(+)
MSWEDEDFEPPVTAPPVPAGQWDDEDADNVKESWDDSDDEKKDKPAETKKSQPKPKPAPKIKGRVLGVSEVEDEKKVPVLSAEEKRKRQILVEDADYSNTKDLFAGISSDTTPEEAFNLDSLPTTEAEFSQYADFIAEKFNRHSTSMHYVHFLKSLLTGATKNMKVEDIKELSRILTVIANEKIKAEKTKPKKKGPTKKLNIKGEDLLDDFVDDYDAFN